MVQKLNGTQKCRANSISGEVGFTEHDRNGMSVRRTCTEYTEK